MCESSGMAKLGGSRHPQKLEQQMPASAAPGRRRGAESLRSGVETSVCGRGHPSRSFVSRPQDLAAVRSHPPPVALRGREARCRGSTVDRASVTHSPPNPRSRRFGAGRSKQVASPGTCSSSECFHPFVGRTFGRRDPLLGASGELLIRKGQASGSWCFLKHCLRAGGRGSQGPEVSLGGSDRSPRPARVTVPPGVWPW